MPYNIQLSKEKRKNIMDVIQTIDGKTGLFGLIGNPVRHTKSPFIHNTLFKLFGINAVYVPMLIQKEHLENAVNGMKAMNVIGFNVTVPYKKDIIKYLDDISNDALLMGAVNTVKNVNGKLKGYNTDAEGFVRDFKDAFDTDFNGKRVLLLGAGGTARALAVKLVSEGIRHLSIVNRTEQHAQSISEVVRNKFGNYVGYIHPESEELIKEFKEYEVVINTTPVGMSTYADETPFDINYTFDKEQMVYDVIYSPERTKFLSQAQDCGCKTRNGFGMLINQGISAFEIWTGRTVSRQQTAKLLNNINELKDLHD
jgi:shikimate dehydrogenase